MFLVLGVGIETLKNSFMQSHCNICPVLWVVLTYTGEVSILWVHVCGGWVKGRPPSWGTPCPSNRNDGSNSLRVLKKRGGRKSISDGVHCPIFLISEYL